MIDGEKLTGIKSGDIAAIFGNALDNAIECAAELPVEKMNYQPHRICETRCDGDSY